MDIRTLFETAGKGCGTLLRGPEDHGDEAASDRAARDRPDVPEHRPLPPHDRARQPHAGEAPVPEAWRVLRGDLARAHPQGGDREPKVRRGHRRFPRDREYPEKTRGDPPVRPPTTGARRPGPLSPPP